MADSPPLTAKGSSLTVRKRSFANRGTKNRHSAPGTASLREPHAQQIEDMIPFYPSEPSTPTASAMDKLHVAFSSDDEPAPHRPELTRRGIHIPSRTSVNAQKARRRARRASFDMNNPSAPTTPESRDLRSSADSVLSYETSVSSAPSTLAPLQTKGTLEENERLEPLLEDDPRSFDLISPPNVAGSRTYSLERRSDDLFSREHLETVFADPALLLRFTSFLSNHRPQSVPILIYYLDALKALRAINYANAVADALEPIEGHDFTEHPPRPTVNSVLETKANQAFSALVRDDLPAYITHVFVQVVSVSIQRRITGTMPPHLRDASEGLAEVFCLTDPSRPDNPIVFASEEFNRTTQYGMSYVIGRNCRFLQGPRTNPFSVSRLREAIQNGKETSEVFLNYRRDGSPFMNLLMMAPLRDSRGTIRYFIGAQVDVSGLVKECTDLEGLQRMLAKREVEADRDHEAKADDEENKDEFQELSEMFNMAELETVRRHGGRMHREQVEDTESVNGLAPSRPRLLLKDRSPDLYKSYRISASANGRLEGVYQHYLLVRPYPSLRILFTSPSLRVPGILQSPFLHRIGGSPRVRDSLTSALAEGRGVTAKIRWLPSSGALGGSGSGAGATAADDDAQQSSDDSSGPAAAASAAHGSPGRPRWIHCTPLLGASAAVGVWMVVLIDDDADAVARAPRSRWRQAPPVAPHAELRPGAAGPGAGPGPLGQGPRQAPAQLLPGAPGSAGAAAGRGGAAPAAAAGAGRRTPAEEAALVHFGLEVPSRQGTPGPGAGGARREGSAASLAGGDSSVNSFALE
ncbi:hypothetical protein BDY21DRAFT_360523 [Lineolata rhizophorae]|uniref:PAC domain-containing protein n=1 Tax=Lineolata rhizophorae TaxID=578093 RepID=A0A6A6PCC0_9PEZI|nr:hypothetical protein BDY21DRAFT_360523 [Lineolata rhizophorae]